MKNEILKYVNNANVEIISSNRAAIYIPEYEIARIIGKEGKNIDLIEKTRAAAQKLLAEDATLANYPRLKVKLSSFEQVAPD